MFEKVLEKILLNNVGQFIDGIDKNNLKIGIWSGDIVIQNIAVKPEVLAMLDLPFRMRYSFVGKLSVSVPWKSLGSKPVEVFLEDVFIIVEPVNQEAWKAVDYNSVTKRIELMDSFVQSYLNKLAEKQAQENKDTKKSDKSMINRITERVIDNIQIVIRNIHVRFENPLSKRKYAWGITLDEIRIFTTNNRWEKEFIDRTEAKNRLEPMRKTLYLSNLGIYWTSNAQELFGNLAPKYIHKNMKELILKDQMSQNQKMEYIIAISAVCRLIQKNKKDPATANLPEFEISLNLKPLNLMLKKPQLEDVIRLFEFVNDYQRFKLSAMKEREKEIAKLSPEEKEKMKEEFKDLFGRIHKNEKAQELKGAAKVKVGLEIEANINRFNELVMNLPDEDLSISIKEVVMLVERERIKKEVEVYKLAKVEKEKKWFGGKKKDGLNDADPTKLNDNDLQAIENYLKNTFEEEEDTATKMEQIAYQPLFSISFTLEGGTLYFCDLTPQNHEEGVVWSYQGLVAKIDVNSKGKYVNITLKDYGLFLRTRYAGTVTYTDTPIIRRLNHWMPFEASGSIISILFEQNPQGKEEGTYISLESQAAEIVFRPLAIQRLMKFFSVSTEDEALKSKALHQLEKVHDKASDAASRAVQSNLKKEINIKFAAPVLVIPFLQNADVQSECWIFNLGDLLVNTQEESAQLYERYSVGLKNLKFQYYPTQDLYMKVSKSLMEQGNLLQLTQEDLEEYKKVFNLVDHFNIDVLFDKMLGGMDTKEEAIGKPAMNIDITIPSINLQINPEMYKNLLKTKEFVSYSEESEMELMEDEKSKLMHGNNMVGTLYVRETRMRNFVWTKYLCIFKGTYLYFFRNEADTRPSFSYYIRDAEIKQAKDQERRNAFTVENRWNKGYLAAEDDIQMVEWIMILGQKIAEYSAITANVFDIEKNEPSLTVSEQKPIANEPIDYNKISMALTFQIKKVNLALFHKTNEKLFDLETKNFIIGMKQQPGKSEKLIKLQSLDITDYLVEYRNPSFKKLVTSIPSEGSEHKEEAELIEIHLKTLDKSHPSYNENKTDMEMTMKFGYLFFNMKPNTVAEIMRFFLAPRADPNKKLNVKELEIKGQGVTYTEGIDHIMLRINIELKELSVKLINKRTHVCMAELAMKQTSLSVKMKPLSMEVDGVLGNVQLFDTTNYPNTVDSNLEYEKIVPYEMIGVGEGSKNLLELSYRSFYPSHPEADNENKIYSSIDMKMSSIRIHHLQQPLMRLIDYILWQFIPSVKPAYVLGHIPLTQAIQIEKSVAEANLANLQFMNLKIYMKTPIIVLKPTPTSTEYLEIRLGDLMLHSERVKNTTRFKNPTKPLEFVYCERYNIFLRDMCMYRVEGKNRFELSRRVNFDMAFERPLFVQEYQLIYSEGEDKSKAKFSFYNGNKLEGKMTPITMLFQREDYLMIMRCLYFNIQYDDTMDKMFYLDYETIVRNQSLPGTPLDIAFEFENFTLMAYDKKQELPFATINLHLMKMIIARDPRRNMTIQITSSQVNGSYFEIQDEFVLIERKMLGTLDNINKFSIKDIPREQVVEEILTSTNNFARTIAETHQGSRGKEQLNVNIQMTPSRDKVIRIALNELKIYLITGIYLQLVEFVRMDPSVYPAPVEVIQPGQNVNENGEGELQREMSVPTQPQGCMTVSIEVRNILMTMPSSISKIKDSPNVLALKGDISFVYANYPEPNFNELLDDVKKRKITRAIEQCAQFNEIGRISITLHKLQVFVCEFADLLSSKDFSQVNKRNMILPFSLILIRKNHMVLNKERTDLIPVTRHEIHIERLILRLSYQDVNLINNSLQFQMEQLSKGPEGKDHSSQDETMLEDLSVSGIKAGENFDMTALEESMISSSPTSPERRTFLEESKVDFVAKEVKETLMLLEQEKQKENPDDWRANYQEFHIASKGIQIVIINDIEGSLAPVLELTVFSLLSRMIKLPDKLKISGSVELNCSYFNPLPSKWEPFVERFGLNFEFSKGENPKINLIVSMTEGFEEINLNISDEMVAILYSTSMTWKEDYQQKKTNKYGKVTIVNTSSRAKEEEFIDYVSPYTIINNTGYSVEVEEDCSNISHTIVPKRKGSANLQQSYFIENRGMTQYMVESDINKIFERSNQDLLVSTNKVRMKIKHPQLDINPITGVDIDKPRVKQFELFGTEKDGSKTLMKSYYLYTTVKVEQYKKVITLSSPFCIINKISEPYYVIFEADNQTLEIKLNQGESTSVPIDFIEGNFSIKLDANGAAQSQKVPIKSFSCNGEKVREFQVGSTSYVLAKSVQIDPTQGYYDILLIPPYEIKNCCGLELFYRLSDKKETVHEMSTLKPQEILHETKIPIEQSVYLQIRLQGYLWSEKFMIHSQDPYAKLSKKVQVKDARGNLLDILVFIPNNVKGTRKLLLYTKTCIVNETPFNILCYNVEDKKKVQIPGQLPSDSQEAFNSKLTLFNETKLMAFSRRREKEHSGTVNVGSMGSVATELIGENGNTMLDIGVNMSLLRCDADYNLITKIITLSPRFILVNKTEYQIEIRRENSEKVLTTLETNKRTPLYWSDWAPTASQQKSLSIRLLEPNQDADKWSWSNPFDIQSVGLYNYIIQTKDKTFTKFLKTSVTLDYSTLFVVIEEERSDQVVFKVRNECPNIEILVYQTDVHPGNGIFLKTGDTIPWAWVYPNKKKEISASFCVNSLVNYHSSECAFSFDKINTVSPIKIPVDKGKRVKIYATTVVEGPARVLKFFFASKMKKNEQNNINNLNLEEKNTENKINMNIEVTIKKLGLSIISSLTTNKEKKLKERKEVLYLLFKGLEFRMLDSTHMKSSQFRLKYLNFDNNTSYDTSFPVLCTPTKPDDLLRGEKSYFLDILIAQKVNPEVTFYETIQFLLNDSTLKIDGMFINAMMEVASNFQRIFNANKYKDGKGTIAQILYHNYEAAKKLENKEFFSTSFAWLNKELSEFAGGNLYIKKLVLNALFFNISFQLKKADANEDGFFLFNLITSVLGTALANLDSAPLTLSGIVLENVFDSKQAIRKKIVDKYKDEITISIPKLLGSLDIVGNPVGLFKNISSGVVDLVEKPLDGFLQGPLEGTKGLVIGAGSLMKNTVSGTFNSIGKVTGSLASGLSNLTMDDEYLAQREKSKLRRPKHVGEGVVKGVTSIVQGVGRGVTGVFMKPIEGASKGGIKGFLKGAFQGVTGLIIKPVTGVLDAASNTAEGIKNTATAFDQKPNENRMRYPRAFYGKDKFYRTYMETDAEVMWMLHFSEEETAHRDISILSSYDVFPEEKENPDFFILIISFEKILMWYVKLGRVLWVVKSSNIAKVTRENNGVLLHLKEATEIFKDKTVGIKNCDPAQNAFIHKKILELVEFISQND